MMNKKKIIKLLTGLTITAGIIIGVPAALYLKVLPAAVSNPKVINLIQNTAKKQANIDLEIKNPVLKTSLSPVINFNVEQIVLSKENNTLLETQNFKSELSFAEIFNKNLVVNKLTAKYIFADVNKLTELAPQQKEQKKEKSEWKVDLFDSLLGVGRFVFLYSPVNGTNMRIEGHNVGINNAIKTRRHVYFDINTYITKNSDKVHIAIKDDKKVYIENKAIYVKNCPLTINNSKMFFNADADKNNNFNFEVYTKNFKIQDIITLIQTQIIENNLDEVLAYFSGINGMFDFDVKMNNNGMNGAVDLKDISFKVVPVDNIPVTLKKGHISLNDKDMVLKNFEGFYDNKARNKFNFDGTVKDYLKTIDTEINAKALATNDLFKKHLSAMAGCPIELTGDADTTVKLLSKNNVIDVKGVFKLDRNVNITVDGEPLPFSKVIRALTANMHFENMILDINSIKYYMEAKNSERDARRPIFTISSQIDTARNNFVNKVGFEIPDPLPSEFLNAVLKQRLFKKGTVSGNLNIDNTGKYPVLNGNLKAEKIRIPSQRTYIKSAELVTKNNLVHMNAFGKYKRSDYKFTGDILNEIKFPIIVKDIHLTLDYLDVYKAIAAPENIQNNPNEINVSTTANADDTNDTDENAADFDIGNLIIEQCQLSLNRGDYKDIHFANLNANMALNKDSILTLDSNKFDIAEGISTIKVRGDLKNSKYYLRLGIKDVNSDTFATSLLDLKREISGKASGLIELTTDSSLKLNGSIKFLISNGTIQKVGLVEYVLKFAALFRNPLTMISPATFSDLVNIPEGNFDKITGDILLKDNIIQMMKIKSSSPQLASYIVGRYDLETKDATLRIYTKFSSKKKGLAGVLRNISLNSLANRMTMSSRNDANYYASELVELPELEADEKDCQIFLTRVDGDVEHNNFLSSLKKLK